MSIITMLFKVYSGLDFNTLMRQKKFYKFTNESENHNGFQFQTGLNIDIRAFNPEGECNPGGIYFTEEDRIWRWHEGKNYCRVVIIPDDAQVYIERNKYKADRIILEERTVITENEYLCDIIAKEYNGMYLRYIAKPSLSTCLAALNRSGHFLQYIKDQTPEICLAAVKNDGYALQFVKEQTPEICLAAIKQNINVITMVKEQTSEIYLAMVKKNGYNLLYVKKQTPEICLAAVRQNKYALQFVKEQTREILAAVRKDD